MATEYNLGRVVGLGVPSGGADGDVLLKNGSEPYGTRWGIGQGEKIVPFTILADEWDTGAYAVENPAITATTNVSIELPQNVSAVQAVAFTAARMRSGQAGSGSVELTASTPPTIDIPVLLVLTPGNGTTRVQNWLADVMMGAAGGVATLDVNGRLRQKSPDISNAPPVDLTLLNGATTQAGMAPRCTNVGGIATCSGRIIPPDNTASVQYTTMPERYRPKRSVVAMAAPSNGLITDYRSVMLGANGSVILYGAPVAGMGYTFYATYEVGS